MKSTDINRKQREILRAKKKAERLAKKVEQRDTNSPGYYIKELAANFYYDDTKIYNIGISEEVLDLVCEMKENISRDQWDTIFSKAVKQTKVTERDQAMEELKALLD